MPAIRPSSLANRCRGPQPVRAQADPDFSAAKKKACEIKGLYLDLKLMQEPFAAPCGARVARLSRLTSPGAGLAQASHSSALMSLTEGTASRDISDGAIDDLDRSHVTIG